MNEIQLSSYKSKGCYLKITHCVRGIKLGNERVKFNPLLFYSISPGRCGSVGQCLVRRASDWLRVSTQVVYLLLWISAAFRDYGMANIHMVYA